MRLLQTSLNSLIRFQQAQMVLIGLHWFIFMLYLYYVLQVLVFVMTVAVDHEVSGVAQRLRMDELVLYESCSVLLA